MVLTNFEPRTRVGKKQEPPKLRPCGSLSLNGGEWRGMVRFMAKKLPAIMTVERRRKAAAKKFAEKWLAVEGRENEDSQRFWMELLQSVYGVVNPADAIRFEYPVDVGSRGKGKIDAFLPETRVVIEQKSSDIDLTAVNRKAGELELTPYQQAKRYAGGLPYSKAARWIVTCNFREFRVHDLDSDTPGEPVCILKLEELAEQFHVLDFLVDAQQVRVAREREVSEDAGRLISRIYHALLAKYPASDDSRLLHDLNKFCVRLVFCLYAEDAGLFTHGQFWQYVGKGSTPSDKRQRMLNLFHELNRKPNERNLDEELRAFPYVNGGLFDDNELFIPMLDEGLCKLLEESSEFDWREISPTIFGGLFESTLNPHTRNSGGMFYTSIENIHKVIDPLFMDGLHAEFEAIRTSPKSAFARKQDLLALQDKMSTLTFLDPACGSGNFLTETFISLRKLENAILAELQGLETINKRPIGPGQRHFGGDMSQIKVSIHQFFGVEINDFAVSVARTALWIADAQMWEEAQEYSLIDASAFLPLKKQTGIREGNALRVDWLEGVPGRHVDFIIGNPPFAGARSMEKEQKEDLLGVFDGFKNAGDLDFVAAWYKKAVDIMKEQPSTRTALVSTNSITQGQQVALLWQHMAEVGCHIDFAYRTFKWQNGAVKTAAVHCVIIGFSCGEEAAKKMLVDEQGEVGMVEHINGYLVEAEDVFINNRTKPLCDVPEMGMGNQPIDNGNYLFTDDGMADFLAKEPAAEPYFREWMGAEEFINGKPRHCLWLGDCSPAELSRLPESMKRVEAVRDFRAASKRESTRNMASYPRNFQTENMPKGNFVAIPETSSESRDIIPMGFLTPDILCSNAMRLIPDATLYHFGVLTSGMHMAWTKAVCGRLEMRYRYSNKLVYNNFPWPSPTAAQKREIEKCAKEVLDARAACPDSSLADLYNPLKMPPALTKAHRALDAAVERAYGKRFNGDAARVAYLFGLYQDLVK